jgi:hypothetical protein
MAKPALESRLAAIDIENPLIDVTGIETGLLEHLARLDAPAARLRLVSDLEAGFREVARMARRGWEAGGCPGPRWTHRSGYSYDQFGLWNERPYFRTGRGFDAASVDRNVVDAARRSATHWRNRRRASSSGVKLARPIIASRVALRALWDESAAAEPPPEPPRPGQWRADFTDAEKRAHWERQDAWRKWLNSSHHSARDRLKRAEPLVSAVACGLFAFFWLHRRDRRWRTHHACLAVPRPQMLTTRVPRGRFATTELHAWDEPAVRWPEGPSYWYWQGIRIWREVVEQPSRLNANYIIRQANLERRRVLLERIGYERFLATANAELVQQDDYGKLWKTDLQLDDEPVTVVEVANATREPDGTFHRYFLRVPPAARTAREAVAWTFGFDKASDYEIAIES